MFISWVTTLRSSSTCSSSMRGFTIMSERMFWAVSTVSSNEKTWNDVSSLVV